MREQKLRAVIVDDEPLARMLLRKLLASDAGIEVAAELGDAPEAIAFLKRERADLVFLDIEMPEKNGFAVLEALGEKMPPVIFVTAFDEYAIRGFEVHALDYLLKPFSPERLDAAVERAKNEIARDSGTDLNRKLMEMLREHRASNQETERLILKCDDRAVFIPCERVRWIEAQGNYVTVHTDERKYLLREPISALEGRLDSRRFRRIQRSVVVNLDHVSEIRPGFHRNYCVVLRDGTELKLSHRFRDSIGECLGGKL